MADIIPIPVIALIFPEGATAGVLLVFNVGVEAALWTLGILVLTGQIAPGTKLLQEQGELKRQINITEESWLEATAELEDA